MDVNVLKQDLNKVWFDLKETNTDSEREKYFKGQHNIQ